MREGAKIFCGLFEFLINECEEFLKMGKYVQKSLMTNEKVVLEAKYSFILFAPSVAVLVLAILFFAVSLKDGFGEAFQSFVIWAVIAALLSIRGFLYNKFNEFAVTDKKVIGKSGIIKTNELSSPLKQIQNVQVKSGFFGKIFKYGTVIITTTSGVYAFNYINKPTDFRNMIMSQIEKTEENKMDLHAQKIAQALNKNNEE